MREGDRPGLNNNPYQQHIPSTSERSATHTLYFRTIRNNKRNTQNSYPHKAGTFDRTMINYKDLYNQDIHLTR